MPHRRRDVDFLDWRFFFIVECDWLKLCGMMEGAKGREVDA